MDLDKSCMAVVIYGRITGHPNLTRRWPFGRVTEGLPTTREEQSQFTQRPVRIN
jgi:hypothetical protein